MTIKVEFGDKLKSKSRMKIKEYVFVSCFTEPDDLYFTIR